MVNLNNCCFNEPDLVCMSCFLPSMHEESFEFILYNTFDCLCVLELAQNENKHCLSSNQAEVSAVTISDFPTGLLW